MPLRAFLPTTFLLFFVLAFALPAWRRPEALVLHRSKRPVERVVGVAFVGLLSATAAWVALVAAVGPAALGAGGPLATGALGAVGEALVTGALAVVVIAQTTMGASFRVGIDDAQTALVTRGPFAVVRNPIFAALVVAGVGLACATPSPWTAALAIDAALVVAIQVRLEEEHLLAIHGDAYVAYAARVGRFVPRVGLLGRRG